jgi:hypothetical protein
MPTPRGRRNHLGKFQRSSPEIIPRDLQKDEQTFQYRSTGHFVLVFVSRSAGFNKTTISANGSKAAYDRVMALGDFPPQIFRAIGSGALQSG